MLQFWHKQISNASISHFCPVVCPFALQATCPVVYVMSYCMTLQSSTRIAAKRNLCLAFLKYNFSVITVYECVEYLTFPDPWHAVETLSLWLIIHIAEPADPQSWELQLTNLIMAHSFFQTGCLQFISLAFALLLLTLAYMLLLSLFNDLHDYSVHLESQTKYPWE